MPPGQNHLSETIAPPSLVHGKDQNIGQEKQHSTDMTPIDAMNIGKNKIVFRMDMAEEERFSTLIQRACNESNKMHNKAKQLTKKPKQRITVAISAMRRTTWGI